MPAFERCALRCGAVVMFCFLVMGVFLAGCAPVDVPESRLLNIPTPQQADERRDAVNEMPDSVLYLPLGQDVLMPMEMASGGLPDDMVGPFELRSETLAGALQLILADYEVPLAFETEEGLTRQVTVANLRGPLNRVVKRVCGLADLYCAFEDGLLIVKERQTFTIKIPPISGDTGFISNVASGLAAIIGESPVVDDSTRTIIYSATHRNAAMAERYFQHMRSNTALIIFETYVWEVQLNTNNAQGIDWSEFVDIGKFNVEVDFSGAGAANAIAGNPVNIGLPTTQTLGGLDTGKILRFISSYGSTKTISQPQISVLSGSSARFRSARENSYVAEFSETLDDNERTVAVSTGTVDSGLELEIGSSWDNATVYATISITLNESTVGERLPIGGDDTNSFIQLPETNNRELETQVRIRPGDSVLIAGLVQEEDDYDKEGFGVNNPFLPYSRQTLTSNSELVFLLRPRVIVYVSPDEEEYYKAIRGRRLSEEDMVQATEEFVYDFAPLMDGPKTYVTESLPGSLLPGMLNPGRSYR